MAVVGATVTVFAGGASELGHRYYHRIFGEVAEIGPQGGDGLRKLASDVGDLALRAAFVRVMIPSADVGERDLHAEVGFDELRELLETFAEASARIVRAGRGRVL